MKSWLIKYFGFTRREYNGLMALMAVLLLITLLPYGYSTFFAKPIKETPQEQRALSALTLVNNEDFTNELESSSGNMPARRESVLFKFDPNQIDAAQWRKLGLSIKQAQSILNYRNKGGMFYKPADLGKMYALSAKKFQELLPYVAIDPQLLTSGIAKRNFPAKLPYSKNDAVMVEINRADTLALTQIKGIGAAFARRIVKYRERLGGFLRKEQLLEVFGLDSMKLAEIKDQVTIGQTLVKRININTADFEVLKNHPYLKYKQIIAILQYRKQHGNYNSIDDLKKVVILSPEMIELLAPYLTY